MKKIGGLFLLLLCGCTASIKPHHADFSFACQYRSQQDWPAPEELLSASRITDEIDWRSCDLSALDLSAYPSNLVDYIDFDSKTYWPAASKMPPGLDLESVMETGKNPGLVVRGLHAQGIDGRGISIAIIGQELLTTHQEYADRLAR